MDRKQEVLDFVLKNKRWPHSVKENKLYETLKIHIKRDGWFCQQVMPYKQGFGLRVNTPRKPRGKSKKTLSHDTKLIRLGLQLMDSGGCGW